MFDIAVRSVIYFLRGQEGRFIARTGHSSRRGKRKLLSFGGVIVINIGLIGFGYWGPNLARNFAMHEGCLIKTIVDLDNGRLALAKKLYPQALITKDVSNIFDDPQIDGVVIASPVSLHYLFAKQALFNDKHVFVEKPMSQTSDQASELIDISLQKKKTLMVDHTFLYTGAIRKMRELISCGDIGAWQYFDSTRINLGLFHHDINVVWDLAPHDISIMRYLTQETPSSLIATGISHMENGIENIAYITLFFQANKIAHLHLSWTSPVKIRKILIGGTLKMIVFDDIEPTEKVKIYDSGYFVRSSEKLLVDYRTGDIHIPKADLTEALYSAAEDFLAAVRENKEPVSNWKMGLDVVRILEATDRSIKSRGKEVILH